MRAVWMWFARPWLGLREAKAELRKSQTEGCEVRELAADLDRIHAENHIAEQIHRAMRGARRPR